MLNIYDVQRQDATKITLFSHYKQSNMNSMNEFIFINTNILNSLLLWLFDAWQKPWFIIIDLQVVLKHCPL